MYLSKNRLQSLEGLQSLHALQKLSLAENQLEEVEVLDTLAACSHLKALNLEGNPMCRAPFFRCAVSDSFLSKILSFCIFR